MAAERIPAAAADHRWAMIRSMATEYARLRRRPFLAPIWIFGLAAVFALLVAGWAIVAASTTVVVVIRHAEKAIDETPDPALSPAGLERAGRLATIFGTGPKGLAIDAIFVTQWQRSADTARPLAARLGLPLERVPDDDRHGLEQRILDGYRGRRVLVVAHSDTVADIVRDLAHGSALPAFGEIDYGMAYVIAIPRWSRPTVLALALP